MDRDELGPTLPTSDEEDGGAPEGTIGRFVSLGVLGRGGMGIVLRARDPELDREVAIKVLTSRTETSDGGHRLQREAQAMAKLSHPNVVTVYEMGQVGDERFIAMELIEGATLRQWLATRRPWREIVTAFVACGRGLAAAHAAGIVHRDFKPENVLIGPDGRPRVGDFGLVGIERAVAGTPAYMAPEQWLGEDTDARSDVFAFCVALWEALYEQKPFAGEGDELRANVIAGKLVAPPRDHEIDARFEPLLRRGLSRTRDDRWPAMAPLLAELDRKPVRRWPWIAGGVGAAGVIAAGVAIASSGGVDPCPDPEPQLATIWDQGVEASIVAAFRSAAPALADDTSTRVVVALDRYAKQWREASIGACRATHVDGTQSPELLDRRVQCLDRRKSELAALTTALAKSDRARVAGAVDAVGSLGALEQCANRDLLLALAPPSDPELRRKVEALDREIDATYASHFTDKPAVRQARAAKLVEEARALSYPPVLVRALDEANDAANDNSDQKASEAYMRELAQRAAEAHDDNRAARAWIDLIRLLSESRRIDEAKTLEPVAAAAVARAGSPASLRYVELATIGVRKMYSQDYVGSIASLKESVATAETDRQRSATQLMLAQVVYLKDGPRAALPLVEASLAATEKAYGKIHPQTAQAKHLMAQFMTEGRDLARAVELETEVVAIREAAYGPDHREVAIALHVLGNLEKGRRKLPEARKHYERAVAILDADRGTVDAGLSRGMLATVIADTDGIAAARPVFARALQDLATAGKEQVQYIAVEVDYAYRLLDAELCSEAAPLLSHAIEALPDKRMRQLPQVLEASAHCDVLAKQPALALEKLERARKLCTEVECPAQVVPMVAFKLGRLLIERGTDRARGQKLVDEARTEATALGDKDLLSDIDHWQKRR